MHGIPERPAGHAEIRNEHSAPKETAPRSTEHTSAHDSPDILELPHSAPPPPPLHEQLKELPHASAKLDHLSNQLSKPEVAADFDSHKTLQQAADKAYADRGFLSKLRDTFSLLFGKSNATKAYDNFNDQMSIAKTNLNSVNDMEQTFGSGVKLSPKQKQDWVNLLSQLNPEDRKSVIDSIQEKQPGLAFSLLFPAANEAGIDPSDQRMQTAKMLLNTLQEQLRPEVINTQFKHEFVPKTFMSPEERRVDGELMREHKPILDMQDYEKSLPQDSIQKQNFANMLGKAEGFTRGENMELTFGGGGTLPEATLAKIYGIKRTPEGFSSVLGFGQGDRNAVGIDKMPWRHETTLDQDASIMKILRQVEKPANPEERATYFDNAYDNYGANLPPERKAELKQTLLDFADARTKRLDSQLKEIIGKD